MRAPARPLLTLALAGCLVRGQAQGGVPRSWSYDGEPTTPVLELPPVSKDRFVNKHAAALGTHPRHIAAVAHEGSQEFDALPFGNWTELPDGLELWRLSVQSASANSLILLFSHLQLPPGTELFLYSAAATERSGRSSCTPGHCSRLNATTSPAGHKFTSPRFPGGTVVMELSRPSSRGSGPQPTLLIASIMQGIDDYGAEYARLARAGSGGDASVADGALSSSQRKLRTLGTQFPIDSYQENSTDIAKCTHSVVCDPDYDIFRNSVVAIYAVDMSLGMLGLCTGTLISGPYSKVRLLTADHCFVDPERRGSLATLEYWVLIFEYQEPCGMNDAPPVTSVTQGVQLLFYNKTSDILLLELESSIPTAFRPYYLGFDSRDYTPARAVGIHHPHGTPKRISYVNGTIQTNYTPIMFPPDEVQPRPATHFQVMWTEGVTQAGSSGSPLIDADTKRVVAVLTGGASECGHSRPDYYGKISAAWENGLEYFLSDAGPTEHGWMGMEDLNGGHRNVTFRSISNFSDGRWPSPNEGPGILFWPSKLNLYPDNATQPIGYYLTSKPKDANNTVVVEFKTRSLPGNTGIINMTHHVTVSPSRAWFNADNFSAPMTATVHIHGVNLTAPDLLLRFDMWAHQLTLNGTSLDKMGALKGILQPQGVSWTDFDALNISALPFWEEYPIKSPQNKAMFQYTPIAAGQMDLAVCARDFKSSHPYEDAGDFYSATLSMYENTTFIWTLSHHALGLNDTCISVSGAQMYAGNTYHLVVSDEQDFNAVLPMDTLALAYMGPSGTLLNALTGRMDEVHRRYGRSWHLPNWNQTVPEVDRWHKPSDPYFTADSRLVRAAGEPPMLMPVADPVLSGAPVRQADTRAYAVPLRGDLARGSGAPTPSRGRVVPAAAGSPGPQPAGPA